ncbi:unnamed protein product [Phytomonas sp. EM1]|nr:unnamed protein product [Phytomonas sp. EM1]|eukprot:CCW64056.1 unnamed protein product [Phytomonas sp. isolate EM1]
MHKKLILFGGTGFVGFQVLRKALLRGYTVVVPTRHGAPTPHTPLEALATRVGVVGGRQAAAEVTSTSVSPLAEAGSTDALRFTSVDATNPSQVQDMLREHADATVVVSCIGLLTLNYDQAKRVNGEANLNILHGVWDSKLLPNLKKFVYVSAEPFNEYCPSIFGSQYLLKGYFEGKQSVEREVFKNLGECGVVLRPGFIYGTRYATLPLTQKVLPVPLGLTGYPLHRLLKTFKGGKLLTPPVDVELVAETAIRACAWSSLPALNFSGPVNVYKMLELCSISDPTLEPTTHSTGEGESKAQPEGGQ